MIEELNHFNDEGIIRFVLKSGLTLKVTKGHIHKKN